MNIIGKNRRKSCSNYSQNYEKVLILSYFFPPCNLTAASRPMAYARYLHESGFYPVIITRNWDNEILTSEDVSKNSGEKSRIEYYDHYEVHYMPFAGSFKDRFIEKNGLKRKILQRKLITMGELVLNNFTISHLSYKNIYYQARQILGNDKEITKMIAIANPFQMFHLGYLLKKEFPFLKWVADYRDDWNTQELNVSGNSVIKTLESFSEKKWVGNAASITSVSDVLTERISSFVGKPGVTVANGFFEELYKEEYAVV